MWSLTFWAQAVERAIKTASQTTLGLVSGDGLGLLEVEWWSVGSVAGLAAIASILTSIASTGSGPSDSPSLVPTSGRVIRGDNPPLVDEPTDA